MIDRIAEMRAMACNQGHPLRDKLIEGEVRALLDCAEALQQLLDMVLVKRAYSQRLSMTDLDFEVDEAIAALARLNGDDHD